MQRKGRRSHEETFGNGFISLKLLELNSQYWTSDLKLYNFIFSVSSCFLQLINLQIIDSGAFALRIKLSELKKQLLDQ